MGQAQVKEADEPESTPILLPEITGEIKNEKEEYPIHRAAYLGDVEKLQELLSTIIPNSTESLARRLDTVKFTPLHHAANSGNVKSVEIAKILLKRDEDDNFGIITEKPLLVNLQDSKEKIALHYACRNKQVGLVSLLLDYGADPNIRDADGSTPLHIAVEGNSEAAIKCAEILLASKIIRPYEPSGPKRNNQTVLHIAANAKAPDMVKFLINKGFNYAATDSRGMSPLHYAASSGDSDDSVSCVKNILRVSNYDEINMKSDEKKMTALNMASYKSYHKVVEALLAERNVDIWSVDCEKRTALHLSVEAWFRPTAYNCVKLLVESEKISSWHNKAIFLYDLRDSRKQTALEIALKHGSVKIAELLILAHPTPEAWLKDGMLRKIYNLLPEAMIPLMNKSLTYNPAIFHDRNEAVDVDFGTITGYSDPLSTERPQQETKYLNHIRSAPKEIQTAVLLHPVVQMFLSLKWKKIRWITWAGISFNFVWLILYTLLIVEVYAPNCPEDDAMNTTTTEKVIEDKSVHKTLRFFLSIGFAKKDNPDLISCGFNEGAAKSFAAILILLSIIIAAKEVFQMTVTSTANYFKDIVNYAQWTLLLVFFINTGPAFGHEPDISRWQYHLAAFGIGLAWILWLREIGKFPSWGIYSAILKKVFWHCLAMLLFYIPLFVGFSLVLSILVPGKGQYKYFLFGIIKVVIMMTGELDFEDAFYGDDGPFLTWASVWGQIVFVLLVFVTTIVLLNLLTGLAVNDVQSLIEEAEVNRLSNELEQIYLLETLILWCRRKVIGMDKGGDLLQRLNVTSSEYEGYRYFAFKLENIETKSYPSKLRKTIRDYAVPNEAEE